MHPHTARPDRPTPAERLRAIVATATSMTVVTDGLHQEVHTLDGAGPMGRIHLHEPTDVFGADHRTPRIPIRLELTDVSPVPVRDRVRARVTISGLVADPYEAGEGGGESVCMEFGQAVLETTEGPGDSGGRAFVTLAELQTAELDPLASCEAPMLHHLVAEHPELVTLLLRLVEPSARRHLVRALPVAIDRFGLTLRLEYRASRRDVRLPFPTALQDVDQAGLQIHALLAAARRASHTRLPA
ncbi:DUF2470 domain-containing protein [Streptomyces sp. NPDC090025]|uniref:DUF2470 domain-containing protein n=1 Tax=Streptomyces sp. NPDC090025 TaxID=3365922 RepID=UPI0038372B11